MKNASFPIFLKLDQMKVLVVGGGQSAVAQLRVLMQGNFQPQVSLVSPEICPEVEALALTCTDLELVQRRFIPSDLQGCQLAILTTQDPLFNEGVRKLCSKAGILLNITTQPDLSDFSLGVESPEIVKELEGEIT